MPELVGQFRVAGAGVSLQVDGDTGSLPATVGSAVYRILQESLTNAAKHAPGSVVEVRLAVRPRSVKLQVDSAGRPGLGSGMGLLSMRERAEALGGRCTAGPAGDGWTVRADLPLSTSAQPGQPAGSGQRGDPAGSGQRGDPAGSGQRGDPAGPRQPGDPTPPGQP